MIFHETTPDFREIETPWEPQDIAWRFLPTAVMHVRDKAAITLQVNNPRLQYLVREVQVMTRPNGDTLSVEETRDDLRMIDEQFAHFEAHSHATVAPHEWHVFKDLRGATRTLARVAIIDGKSIEFISKWVPHNHDLETVAHYEALEASRDAYRTPHRTYIKDTNRLPLADITNPRQYIMGSPRDQALAKTATNSLYLVDIEPLLRVDTTAQSHKALPIDTRGERIIA